jgi:hypothetical protein
MRLGLTFFSVAVLPPLVFVFLLVLLRQSDWPSPQPTTSTLTHRIRDGYVW